MTKQKIYKGEKYIYLLMGYKLAKASRGEMIAVGNDNGMVGGQNYYRRFTVHNYGGKVLLVESKVSRNFADYTRVFEVWEYGTNKPVIKDYINESGENCGQAWIH